MSLTLEFEPNSHYFTVMNALRASHSFRLLLISLLLWAQSAVALHEVDHSWHDASEICQVFSSADHSTALISAGAYLAPNVSFADFNSCLSDSYNERDVAQPGARDPPQ